MTTNDPDEVHVFPVDGWDMKYFPPDQIMTVQLRYRTHPFQKDHETQLTQRFALTLEAAEALRADLDIHIEALRSGPASAGRHLRH